MRRGTTPFIEMKTDQDISGYSNIVFTAEDVDGNQVSVTRASSNMKVSNVSVVVKLTQEQTLSLVEGTIKMQLWAADATGANAIASNIMYDRMEELLKDGENSG